MSREETRQLHPRTHHPDFYIHASSPMGKNKVSIYASSLCHSLTHRASFPLVSLSARQTEQGQLQPDADCGDGGGEVERERGLHVETPRRSRRARALGRRGNRGSPGRRRQRRPRPHLSSNLASFPRHPH